MSTTFRTITQADRAKAVHRALGRGHVRITKGQARTIIEARRAENRPPPRGAPVRREAPLFLFAAAVAAFAVAFVSMLSHEVDVAESVWLAAGLLATAVAFFLKEL